MPRLPIGPANIAPPLRCEQLEDRSLLSSTTLYSIFGDLGYAELVLCEEVPAGGVALEAGGTALLYEENVTTLEWVEGRDGLLTEEEYWDGSENYDEYAEEWYYEDELYYEDEWYHEDETWDDAWYYEDDAYYDDSWYYEDETYYEDEYWDDAWSYDDEVYYENEIYYEDEWYYEDEYWDDASYSDEAYSEESWDGEHVFIDGVGMTWEEYEGIWLTWDRSNAIPEPVPGEEASDWSWTLADFGEVTDLDDGMVYAMAISGGIAVPDAPSVSVNTPVVDLLPLPVPTTEADAGVAPALPPASTAPDLTTPPDASAPLGEESTEIAALPAPEQAGSDEAVPPALAAPSATDDHLTEGESLELTEDLRIG